MSRVVLVAVLLLVTCMLCHVEARVSSRSRNMPACYRNFKSWSYDEGDPCKNPMYTTCRLSESVHVCCSPDHYCCNNGQGCCRKGTNTYEIFGIICGLISWLAILAVIGICVVGNCIKKWGRRKIVPFIISSN